MITERGLPHLSPGIVPRVMHAAIHSVAWLLPGALPPGEKRQLSPIGISSTPGSHQPPDAPHGDGAGRGHFHSPGQGPTRGVPGVLIVLIAHSTPPAVTGGSAAIRASAFASPPLLPSRPS